MRIFGRRLFTVLSLGWAIGSAPACKKSEEKQPEAPQPEAPADPAERTTAEPRPAAESKHQAIFFRVEKDGAVNHFLGTMHLGFDYQELPPVVWEQLRASKKVAVETDIMNAAVKQMAASQLPEGESLKDKLGEEVWAKLVTRVTDVPPQMLERMQPWFVGSMLLMREHPTALPMDLAVLREAQKQDIEVMFLEPIELQLELLPQVMDEKAIVEMLDPDSEMKKLLGKTVSAYQKGDFEALTALVLDPASYGGKPEMLKPFILDRNAAWIDKLAPHMAAGGVFVAVGAGHLGGDGGLIVGFEKQGYKVTRVPK